MAADLNKLRRQRAGIKGACTRIKGYVDSNLQITPAVVLKCEERFKKLEKYWSDYSTTQSEIEEMDESECADRVHFENTFYALSADLRRIIDSMSANNRLIVSGSISPATDYLHADHASSVRLPKLNLPSFSGKYEDWFSFHDIFNKIIDGNPSLSNSERFQYLKTSLTGEAADIIDSLEITDENYAVARELLRERYDNVRHIVNAHITAIFELPSMTRENARELRHIADGAAKHVRALRALKRPTDSWDDLLIYILTNKLDSVTRREWQASLTVPELPTLSQFLKFLNHTCGALESAGKNSSTSSQPAPRNQPNIKKHAAHVATIRNKCTFCAGEFFIYFCKEFTKLSVEQRILEMRKRKLCTNCLKSKGHSSEKCTSGACKTCGKKHNTLLHLPTRQPVEPDDAGPSSIESSEDAAAAATVGAVSTVSSYVMLSTAVVYAYDSVGSRKLCRVLLDCGSQANLTSRSFFNLLKLKARMLNVSLAGINHTTTSASQVVQLKVQSRLGAFSTVVSCIVVDRITDRLPSIPMKRNDMVLPSNIKLADPQFYESSDIDVLIGAEVFWQLLCVGQVRSPSDHLTLQKTRLGWILAGRAGDPRPASFP
ncbi:uncharacterized protein LOC114882378 [Osmia bicornis bicornis]|uniref:uncharacterized protein LOC114882378 n=1 Tax=Osmia bicornis bicornis TaxID=1437191 RepID=UPI001EAEED38|nr:uncharacterized protein LOC114882378 [Osmia bicornis bicornis]